MLGPTAMATANQNAGVLLGGGWCTNKSQKLCRKWYFSLLNTIMWLLFLWLRLPASLPLLLPLPLPHLSHPVLTQSYSRRMLRSIHSCIHSVSLFMLGLRSLGIWARLILSACRNGKVKKNLKNKQSAACNEILWLDQEQQQDQEPEQELLFCLPCGQANKGKHLCQMAFW